jgi:FMN phosphatase YigB (HAD superfamily)
MSNKIFVFDFDGVVCDSTDECMVSSWNAWEAWNSRTEIREKVEEFTKEEQVIFRKIRPRVRGAGEYYILRRAISEGISIESQDVYDNLERRWKDYLNPFKKVFFEMRDRLREINLDQWIDLHPIYIDVINVMKELHSQERLYIATMKDAESVRLILGKQGLVLPEENLLDQSKIKTKVQALDQFRDQLKCNKKDIIFIDDNVTHLLEPQLAGYSIYLTTWGNPISEYLSIAKDNYIPLLSDCAQLLTDFR